MAGLGIVWTFIHLHAADAGTVAIGNLDEWTSTSIHFVF